MKKLLTLSLLLVASNGWAESNVCTVDIGGGFKPRTYIKTLHELIDQLERCKDGQNLLALAPGPSHYDMMRLVASYCDLKFNIETDREYQAGTFICVFKNHGNGENLKTLYPKGYGD